MRNLYICENEKRNDTEKKEILKSIESGYKEVKKAEAEGQKMPLLDDLIAELQ